MIKLKIVTIDDVIDLFPECKNFLSTPIDKVVTQNYIDYVLRYCDKKGVKFHSVVSLAGPPVSMFLVECSE